MSRPLSGLNVIEMGEVEPVAFCTAYLARLGAAVVRVAAPGRETDRAGFIHLSRGKAAIQLDLTQSDAREVVRRLVRASDILVEGFRPGVMERLGAGYRELASLNPRLVYCSLSSYGQSSELQMPGHDLNFLGLSGLLDSLERESGDTTIPLNLVDIGGGAMHAVAEILGALVAVQRGGSGSHVDVSYLDASLSLLSGTPDFAAATGGKSAHRGRRASMFSGEYPFYTVYIASDGKRLTVACIEKAFWEQLCETLGRADLKSLAMTWSDLTRPAGKAQHQAKNALQAIFSTRPRDEWLSILDRVGVPAGKVLSVGEVMQDPELVRRLNRFELDDGPSRTDRDVLSWLGYKPKEIDALTTRASGGSSPGQGWASGRHPR
jgi:crotonobetainyl-CoA:carnitine CoA-transferase CaiB-like acyl-CoA transferase